MTSNKTNITNWFKQSTLDMPGCRFIIRSQLTTILEVSFVDSLGPNLFAIKPHKGI